MTMIDKFSNATNNPYANAIRDPYGIDTPNVPVSKTGKALAKIYLGVLIYMLIMIALGIFVFIGETITGGLGA